MEEGDPAFWKMLLDRVWPTKHEVGLEGTALALTWISGEHHDEEVVDVTPS